MYTAHLIYHYTEASTNRENHLFVASHEASHTTQDEKKTAEGYTCAGLRRVRGRDALVLRAR
jgi:hypothetical protein